MGLFLRRRRADEINRLAALEMFRRNHVVSFDRRIDDLIGDIFIAAAQDVAKAPRDQPQPGVRHLGRTVEQARQNRGHTVTQIFHRAWFPGGWSRFLLSMGQWVGQNREEERKNDQNKKGAV